MTLLLYEFSLFPAKVLASAFSAFDGGSGVSGSAVSADFHVKSMLLRDGFLDWV
jgi:hypothetical protein